MLFTAGRWKSPQLDTRWTPKGRVTVRAKIGSRLIASIKVAAERYEIWDTELRGFYLRVQPNGEMTYWCAFRHLDGKRTRVKIGDASKLTSMQAKDIARSIAGDIARGLDPARERMRERITSLQQFIEEHYAPWAMAHRKSAQGNLDRLEACFPDFLKKPLDKITAMLLEKWRSERKASGKAAATINRDVAVLKGALSKAVEWEILDVNPLAKVRPLKIDSRSVVRYLSEDEEKALREHLDLREQRVRDARTRANEWRRSRDIASLPSFDDLAFVDHLKPAVLLSMNTGLRRGELLSLTWNRVALTVKEPYLTVSGETAKSGQSRHVHLNREARSILEAWYRQCGCPLDGYVFGGADGRRRVELKTAWLEVLENAGIQTFRWHDLRHHFASRLVMAGVDLNTVRELLGHADLKMTLRYAHLAPRIKAEAVERIVLA